VQFICDPCKTAANIRDGGSLAIIEIKKRGHSNCKGDTWCDCQHRVGRHNV
jgi:hypothetical protein